MMKTMTFALLVLPVLAWAGPEGDFSQALDAVRLQLKPQVQALALEAQSALPPALGGQSVVRDQTVAVPVPLNAQTVKCSAADYSMPMLKVLVPALAELTVLNHRNTREGAPCIAAGRCGPVGPQDVLKGGEGVDSVPVRVVLKKVARLDGEVCHVSLVETVTAKIRGIAFFHEREQDVAERAAADCR